jgi:hypothetical protein
MFSCFYELTYYATTVIYDPKWFTANSTVFYFVLNANDKYFQPGANVIKLFTAIFYGFS